MQEPLRRRWEGHDWERFAHILIQFRHGGQNVQRVPDRVRGDGGLEFFTTDGCLIQCYAPSETTNVAKATSAIKQKATKDLQKLQKNADIIGSMLQGIIAKRWILLCPFFDDKGVIPHVREKGTALLRAGIPFLAPDFEALVQSQEDFQVEIDRHRQATMGIDLNFPDQTALNPVDTELAQPLLTKLRRAFPRLDDNVLREKAEMYLRSYNNCSNALELLRRDHPQVWERYMKSLSSEEDRLRLVGAGGNAPIDQLQSSLDRVERSFSKDLSTLSQSARTTLANGTLSDWLIRCPLDFH